MIIKLNTASGITVSRVPDASGGSKIWGCNTPDCSEGWTLAGTSGTRLVTSNDAYQYYVYQLDSLSPMGFGAYYPTAGVAASGATLGLATDKDLALLNVGDPVKLNDGSVTSSITAVDVTGKKLVVAGDFSKYPTNSGNYLTGPSSPSKDAAIATDFQFLSSAFASSDGSLTHGTSDWQIAALADTTFTTPLFNAAASSTDLTTWTPGSLGEEVEYRVHVRYTSATGAVSPWSDAVRFKTEKVNSAMATAGNVYWVEGTTEADIKRVTVPGDEKIVNIAGVRTGALATDTFYLYVGTSGDVFKSGATSADPVTKTTDYGSNVIDVWVSYNVKPEKWLALYSDGTLVDYQGPVALPGGEKAKELVKFGSTAQTLGVLSESNVFYAINYNSSAVDVGRTNVPPHGSPTVVTPLTLNLPAGVDLASVGCYLGTDYGLMMVGTDGNLYQRGIFGGIEAHMGLQTTLNTVQVTAGGADTKQWVRASSLDTVSSDSTGWTAVTTDGELWGAAGRSNKCFGTVAPLALTFQKLADNVIDTAIGSYNKTIWYAVHSDGDKVYIGNGSTTPTLVPLATLAPSNPSGWKSLGGLPGAYNFSGVFPAIIIPA